MAKQLTFNDEGLITESELTEDSAFLKEAIKSEGVYNGESIVSLNIEDVYGNPHQPRKFFDNTAIFIHPGAHGIIAVVFNEIRRHHDHISGKFRQGHFQQFPPGAFIFIRQYMHKRFVR